MDPLDLSSPSTSCSYTGDPHSLAALVAKSSLLTLFTLGLNWPFALQSRRQAIWPQVRVGKVPLEWTGDNFQQRSLASGLGRVVMALWALNALVATYYIATGAHKSSLVSLLTYVLGAWLHAMVELHSYRYQLSRTRYAGVPFALDGAPGVYARIYMLNGALALLTLGARYGTFAVRTRRFLIDSSRWGVVSARYTGTEAEANKLYFLGGLASVFTLGAYLPWHIAKLRAYHAKHTSCGPLGLRVTQEGSGLSNLWLKNGFIYLLSFGFAAGYARHNSIQYQMEHLEILGSPESLQQPEIVEEANAPSDGLVDAIAFGGSELFSA